MAADAEAVKEEFKRHKEVDAQQAAIFIEAWAVGFKPSLEKFEWNDLIRKVKI